MITRTNTVLAWQQADADAVAERFWNMLLRQGDWTDRVIKLLGLFGTPEPTGRGRYRHHDGWRT